METAMTTVGVVLVVAFPAFLALGCSYSRRHRPRWPDGEPMRRPGARAEPEG